MPGGRVLGRGYRAQVEASRGYWEPPPVGDEGSTLLGSLERQRATFRWKCADLDTAGLTTRIGASELTLARLLKHLAYMEDLNFTGALAGADLPPPWAGIDAGGRSAWVFASADDDDPEHLYRWWDEAAERSRRACAEVILREGPQATFESGGTRVSVRRLLVDMIEEYGRHTGHADLLREAVDGRTGEDPPGPRRPFALG
jgi:hypothetical protein